MSGFPLVLLGVVHTPVKSSALPSMVFILRKMSALLQVERAADSVSGLSDLRGLFLCKKGKNMGTTDARQKGRLDPEKEGEKKMRDVIMNF